MGERRTRQTRGTLAVCVSYQPTRTTDLRRWAVVKLLRGVLKLNAALWTVWSLASGLAPRRVLEDLLGQPILAEYAWVRVAAVMGVVLALLMVLVAQRLEDVWWWSWAFALLEAGTATVLAVNAVFGLPSGAAAWPWWALAGINAGLGAALLAGLALAGQEKPFA